jgi:copper oxidase (laccase) domain-containing protein
MLIIPGSGYYMGLSGAGDQPDSVPETAVFLNQVHSSRIVVNPAGGESADGMIVDRYSSIPALRVADCLPVFALWDDFAGAAHAGWRGLAGGIVEKLLQAVDQPLRWFITGPCICGDCYTVGEEVRNAVFRDDPSAGRDHPPGRVDLRGSAIRRARKLCGEQFKVVTSGECTMESANLYSFRSNGTTGRNILWLAEIERGEHIRQLNVENNGYTERRNN